MFSPQTAGPGRVFDQINIFDTDNQYVLNTPQSGPSFISLRGTCGTLSAQGKINLTGGAPKNQPISCYPGNTELSGPGSGTIYFEPPSGFWLLNPSAKLLNNSIAGCQDTGAAYWYVTPPD